MAIPGDEVAQDILKTSVGRKSAFPRRAPYGSDQKNIVKEMNNW